MCLLRNPLLYRLLCWIFLNFSFTKPWFFKLKTQYKVLVSYKHEQLSVFWISSQFLLLAPCKSTCFSPVLILNWARLNLDRMGTACFFLLADHWTYQLCDLISGSLIPDLGSLSTQEHHFNQKYNVCESSTISLCLPWGRRKGMEVLIKTSLP